MEDIELGTLLRKARQEKGLTLVDIQERTKIRKKYLEAIEANNFDVLPGKVYLKVFVKGYAREVDINYNELLNYYPVLNIKKEENTNTLHKDYLDGTKVSHKVKRNNKPKKNIFKIIFLVIISLFLIAAAVYTFQYFRNSEIRLLNQNNTEEQQALDQNSEIVVDEESNNTVNNEENSGDTELEQVREEDLAEIDNENDILSSINSGTLSEQNTEIIQQNNFNDIEGINDVDSDKITEIIASDDLREENNIVEETLSNNTVDNNQELNIDQNIAPESTSNDDSAANPANSSENSISEDEQAADQAENTSNTDEGAGLSVEERTIRFMADNTVWVNIRADGETAFSGILEAGDSREFEVDNELYIKIGNASAVTALVNGEERGPWAGTGGIAELEFTAADDGIQINNLRD